MRIRQMPPSSTCLTDRVPRSLRQKQAARSGAILPLIAVCIVILFIAAALSIDIARIHVTRAELRTATDAASRAAMETLSRTQNESEARMSARNLALLNPVAGEGLVLDDNKIVFGRGAPQDDGSFDFVAGVKPYNSVRITGERNAGAPGGPVNLLFGPMFGVSNFEPVQHSSATRLDKDISLVLDVSGSMNEQGRFEGLQNAIGVFLAEMQKTEDDEMVSLSVYNETARPVVSMTSDLTSIETEFAKEQPAGMTAVGEGLKVGLASVKSDAASRNLADKTVILMTDGNHNTGVSPATIADLAAADRITVNTITFSDGANQQLMKEVAAKTGGIHLHAQNNAQLVEVFREIARQLPILLTE